MKMTQSATSSSLNGYVHEEAFDSGYLQVDSIHKVFYEQYGLSTGLPVIFLHGGPGGHTSQANTKYFDPALYRVVLLDQRGAGKSLPRNELRENTTQHLVEDIEKLREHLTITKWYMVFGGSWGTTLSLLYAEKYPERVGSLVLRGVSTQDYAQRGHTRPKYADAAKFFPEAYDAFLSFLPVEEQDDPVKAYYKRLTGDDPNLVAAAAREWNRWGMSIGKLRPDVAAFDRLDDPEWCLTHALIGAHYIVHRAWLNEGQILASENIKKIKDIPGAIVQGRYDLVTPPSTAWEVHKAWPRSSLFWIDDAGHSVAESGTTARLIQVCDELAKI